MTTTGNQDMQRESLRIPRRRTHVALTALGLAVSAFVAVVAAAELARLCPQPQERTLRLDSVPLDLSRGATVISVTRGVEPIIRAVARLQAHIAEGAREAGEKADAASFAVGTVDSWRRAQAADRPPDELLAAAAELPPEGYVLRVGEGGALVVGRDVRGTVYGMETLSQLVRSRRSIPPWQIRDWPDCAVRAAHGIGPTLNDQLRRVVRLALNYKFNMLIFESDVYYRLDDPAVSQQVREAFDYCHSAGIEPIPELQSFGWGHCILKIDPSCVEAELRENHRFRFGKGGFAEPLPALPTPGESADAAVLPIQNADFSMAEGNDIAGWDQDDIGGAIFVDERAPGDRCVRVTCKQSAMKRISQTVPCEPNLTYVLEVDMRSAGVERMTAYFEVYGGSAHLGGCGRVPQTSDWTTRRMVFQTGNAKAITIYLRIQSGTGTAWFDNVTCRTAALLELQNPDFELSSEGDVPAWAAHGDGLAATVVPREAGGKALRLALKQPGSDGGVSQQLLCEPHRDYSIACDLRTEGAEDLRATIEARDGNGESLATQSVSAGSRDWRRGNLLFYSGSNRTVTVHLSVQGSAGSAWFDNVGCSPGPARMINVVATHEMPIVVTDVVGEMRYEEGVDYDIIPVALDFPFRQDVQPSRIRRAPQSRIRADETVLVSYHWAVPGSVTYCPSEPRTHAIMKKALTDTVALLRPRWIHIGHDEPRKLNCDLRCRGRNMAGFELFTDDVRRLDGYAKQSGASVRLMLWHDALTCNVGGTLGYDTGPVALDEIVAGVPKDAIICPWNYHTPDSGYLQGEMAKFADLGLDVLGVSCQNAANTYAWGKAVRSLRARLGDRCLGLLMSSWGEPWRDMPLAGDITWSSATPVVSGDALTVTRELRQRYAGWETYPR